MTPLREPKKGFGPFITPFVAAAVLGSAGINTASAAVPGNLDRAIPVHVRATNLNEALLQLAAQAGLRISITCGVAGFTSRPQKIDGVLTARQALTELLHGTGLRFEEENRTIEIIAERRRDANPPASRGTSSGSGCGAGSAKADAGVPRAADPPRAKPGQPEEWSAQTLGEIIVTAQKYRQRVFDVPINMDVVTAEQLRRLNITSLNELQYDVAGLYVQGGNVSHYIVLRGVSNQSGNGTLVGQYIDDADVSAEGYVGQVGYGTGDLQMFDLDRVEVLKGPQGTLYGDGALGGVIRYITRKPNLYRDQISADVGSRFTQDGGPSERIGLMLNGSLIPGALGVRISGQSAHEGGWVDEPAANMKHINDADLTDLRVETLWRPSERFKALATEIVHQETYGIGAGEDKNGDITPAYGLSLIPNGTQKFTLTNVTLTAHLGPAEVMNSSSYSRHTERDYNQTYALDGEVELLPYVPIASHTFSDELRMHGTWSRLHWLVGTFYKREIDDDEFGATEYFGPAAVPLSATPRLLVNGQTQDSNSEAVFADTSVALPARVTLGAGVRYFRNRFAMASLGDYLGTRLVYPRLQAVGHYTSTDPRVYLQYAASHRVHVYASAAKGFRSGEPDLGLFQGYDPESVWSYDVGTKMRFLRGRVRSDEDAFYEKYSNYVGEGLITVYGVPTFGTFNIGAARIKGVDADVSIQAGRGWQVSAKGELVSSKFVSITATHTSFVPGDRLSLVPGYTFVGSVERKFHTFDRPGFVQLNYSQTGRVVSANSPLVQSDVIRFLSLRAGIHWNREVEISLFAQNLLNDRGYLDPNWIEVAAYRPRPRTFGMDFTVALR